MVKSTKRTMFWGLVGLCQMCGGCSCVEVTCDCYLPPNYNEKTSVTGEAAAGLNQDAFCSNDDLVEEAKDSAELKCSNMRGSIGPCGDCVEVDFPPSAGTLKLEPQSDPRFE